MKPIIKPFDSRWNCIQHTIIKLIPFIVIWSWECGSISKNKTTSLRTLVNRVCSTALNLFPEWISKPPLQRQKNHSKIRNGAGIFSQNLFLKNNLWYNECNCNSSRYSQGHTFMNCNHDIKQ